MKLGLEAIGRELERVILGTVGANFRFKDGRKRQRSKPSPHVIKVKVPVDFAGDGRARVPQNPLNNRERDASFEHQRRGRVSQVVEAHPPRYWRGPKSELTYRAGFSVVRLTLLIVAAATTFQVRVPRDLDH